MEHVRRLQKQAFLAVRAVAEGRSPYKGLPSDAAYRALRALSQAGLIEKRGRGQWRVTDPLLRQYLAALGPAI